MKFDFFLPSLVAIYNKNLKKKKFASHPKKVKSKKKKKQTNKQKVTNFHNS